MTIRQLSKEILTEEVINEILNLWNNEYGFIFPITRELFEKNSSLVCMNASFLAYEEKKLVGFILAKTYNEEFVLPTYTNTGWINLMMVEPHHRKKGIGSLLLDTCVKELSLMGKTLLYIGRDINCYFPGLPEDLKSSLSFFTNRGFDHSGQTHDLLNQNPDYKYTIKNHDYTFRLGTLDDKDNIIEFIKANWPGRWTYEAKWYFDNGGTGKEYMLIFNQDNQIIGFEKLGFPSSDTSVTSYSMTWRNRFERLGGIGPLGVTQSYRGLGLGRDIVIAGMNALRYEDNDSIIIDWTGILDFYRKMGFEVWKVYNYLSKQL